jgi:hypothetical protein
MSRGHGKHQRALVDRNLALSYESAPVILHKLREAMAE